MMESIEKLRKYADGFVTVQTHDDLMGIIDEIEAEIAERVSYEQAAKAWNTRAERTCEELGSIRIWQECYVWSHDLSCGHEVDTLDMEPPRFCPDCGARVVSE